MNVANWGQNLNTCDSNSVKRWGGDKEQQCWLKSWLTGGDAQWLPTWVSGGGSSHVAEQETGKALHMYGLSPCCPLPVHRLNNNPSAHYHISAFCCLPPRKTSVAAEHRKSNQLTGKWNGTAHCSLLRAQVAMGGGRGEGDLTSRRSLKIYCDLNSWPGRLWENLIVPLHNLEQHRRRRRLKAASVTFIIVI